MAQSRLNKAASIFTRANGLVRSKLIPWEDRPIWLDIYKAFPPHRDPLYRSVLSREPQPPLPPKIFYKEDELRAFFFKNLVGSGNSLVLNSTHNKPIWEIFIDTYKELRKEGVSRENIVAATIEEMQGRGYYVKYKDEPAAVTDTDVALMLESRVDNPNLPKEIEVDNIGIDPSTNKKTKRVR